MHNVFLRMGRFGGLLIVIGMLVAMARAHNSWLVSDHTHMPSTGVARLAFVTAHDTFPVSETATDPSRIASWRLMHDGEFRDVAEFAIEGMELAARVDLSETGLYVGSAALHPRFIEMDADAFERYLASEIANDAIEHRRRGGLSDEPGRELYSKFTKTYMRVGTGGTDDRRALAPVGHPLEIVPLSDPTEWTVGTEVRLRVLLNGLPAAGLHVSLGDESSSAHEYVATKQTDERGEVAFDLETSGHIFLRTHEIHEIDDPKADWESYWASLTTRVLPPG